MSADREVIRDSPKPTMIAPSKARKISSKGPIRSFLASHARRAHLSTKATMAEAFAVALQRSGLNSIRPSKGID